MDTRPAVAEPRATLAPMGEATLALEMAARSRSRHWIGISERRLLLSVIDAAAVALAYVVAWNIWTARVRGEGFYIPRTGTILVVALWLIAGRFTGVYELRIARNLRSSVRPLLTTLLCCFLAMGFVFLADPFGISTRPTLLLWPLVALATVLPARVATRNVVLGKAVAVRMLLIAPADVVEKVWPHTKREMASLYLPVAVLDPAAADVVERMKEFVAGQGCDQIVLGVRDDISRQLFRGLIECHESGMVVRSLADVYEELTGRMLLDQLGYTWLISLPMLNQSSRLYAFSKRGLDVATALMGLTVLAVLLPILAPLLYLEGRSVFHRQKRVGKFGREFFLMKLRTMKPDPHGHSLVWTAEGDRRVTPLGAMLRRLHLDELPQAWNILRGDMSVIGPRPEQPHYVELLRKKIDFYNSRLTVRPGLTGWAQVNAGYLSGVDGGREKLSYDLYYIKHQSLSLDFLILVRTAFAVLSLRGR